MKVLAFLLFIAAIFCIGCILLNHVVGWSHEIVFTKKGNEKFDSLDKNAAVLALIFFFLAALCFFKSVSI
ncbi:MAG: hypothetical protein MI892_20815 [Desulfobacterales bacterium]|nr:hypothetical protein [Desulfobacterales bacterium]